MKSGMALQLTRLSQIRQEAFAYLTMNTQSISVNVHIKIIIDPMAMAPTAPLININEK